MSGRKLYLALAGLALLAITAVPARAQRSPYGPDEYNSLQDINSAQEPNQRMQYIDSFLRMYPNSVLRPFVYSTQAQTAVQLKQPATVMKAVEAYLALDRQQTAELYKQSSFNEQQIDGAYYQMYLLYTSAFLQSFREGTPDADATAAKAAEIVRQGLEVHNRLYSQVQPPADETQRKQFEVLKRQAEDAFHNVLAFVSYRKKDYTSAAHEYEVLAGFTPNDAFRNYRLGLAILQKEPRDYPKGFWYVARAVALNIPKSDDVKDFLTKSVAGYQQVLPACAADQVADLIATAGQSPNPPAGWTIADGGKVTALRQELTVKRIFDDLKAGGEGEHLVWLASCGLELPEIAGEVIEVSQNPDNLVTLAMAVTQEASDAHKADVVVKVIAPPESKSLKVGDVVHFTGIVASYQKEPSFQLMLKEGKVKGEDIPKTRGRGGAR